MAAIHPPRVLFSGLTLALLLMVMVQTNECLAAKKTAKATRAEDYLIVHCLLPGQLRQLGTRTSYVSARKPIRTTALECRTRGGEYVIADRATAGAAIKLWMNKAKEGDAEAQTTLGELFEQRASANPRHSKTAATNFATAAGWYQQAAKAGYARAQISLGHLYEQGLGVPQNDTEALRWYRLASNLTPTATMPAVTLDPGPDPKDIVETHPQPQRPLTLRPQSAETNTKPIETPKEPMLKPRPLVGPSITLIDPNLTKTTRGLVKVQVPLVQSLGPDLSVVGRVTAPAGLLSLSVNGSPLQPNAVGLFKTELPIAQSQATVMLTAVDQQGKRSELTFKVQTQTEQTKSNRSRPNAGSTRKAKLPVEFGKFHALLIGNNRYQSLPALETPINDVEVLGKLLSEKYRFNTQVLRNATRFELLSALNKLREQLTSNDNLLIYYAGHGELDKKNMRGHWLPVDAAPDSTANWLSNVDVTDILNVMQAKQILLVVDSCYSGTLTRSSITSIAPGMTEAERNTWLKIMARKRARVVLASGGLAPVLDAGGGKHSVFARAFIETVQANSDVLPGRALHQAVAARVAHAASEYQFEQMPEYAPIARAGHEAGDFVLLPQ